jgi:hypothetical protein
MRSNTVVVVTTDILRVGGAMCPWETPSWPVEARRRFDEDEEDETQDYDLEEEELDEELDEEDEDGDDYDEDDEDYEDYDDLEKDFDENEGEPKPPKRKRDWE